MRESKTSDENLQGGVGRTNFIKETTEQEPEDSNKPVSRDISDIDCQEGSMHHGVKGGNFDDQDEPTHADWQQNK